MSNNMVNNNHDAGMADDFFGVNALSMIDSIPAPPRETAGSAAPYVVVLALLALASAIQALAYPELIAAMFGL
jgi:hypothetical protein